MDSVGWGFWRDRPATVGGPQWRSPAGLKILIPGYVQWSWRQRERAAVLFGSFAVALGVGIFAWGTKTGLAVLAFAFGTHVVSAMDVVRQSAFPGFGRWMPWISTSGGLAFGVYAPVLGVMTLVAWPAMNGGPEPGGYLVNCIAYRHQAPNRGDRVWLRSSPWGNQRVGRVLAEAGQEYEWSQNQLRIDGERLWVGYPGAPSQIPEEMTLVVPGGHVLVAPDDTPEDSAPGEPMIVPTEEVAGRAWARLYPFRDRQLLP